MLILHEPFEHFHAVALGLVLGGIWLSERGKCEALDSPPSLLDRVVADRAALWDQSLTR